MSETTPAAGWYPAPHANNEMRYWDGTQWLEQAPQPHSTDAATVAYPVDSPAVDSSPAAADADTTPVGKKPKMSTKKKWIIGGSIAAGVLLIGGIGNALGAGKDAPSAEPKPTTAAIEPATEEEPEPIMVAVPDVIGMPAADAFNTITAAGLVPPAISSFTDPLAKVVSTSPSAGSEAEEGSEVAFTLEEKPKLTMGQQNAVSKAQSYLNLTGFSRTGLIDQLKFEGFSVEDATFGADNAGADWNAECAEKAQSYIDMTSFSRDGLAEQLAFEGFLPAEIEHGLTAVGY